MFRLFTILVVLLMGYIPSAWGQGVFLNHQDLNPQPNEIYQYTALDTAFAATIPMFGGPPNQSWDFSGATYIGNWDIETGTVSSHPKGNYFPNAHVVADAGTQWESFYIANVHLLTLIGGAGSFDDHVGIYDDPKDYLRYPMSYDTSFNDTYHYDVVDANSGDTLRSVQGLFSADANAYGTVILPTATFNNVLRVHYTESLIEVDSAGNTSTWAGEEVRFYVAGIHHPILLKTRVVDQGVVYHHGNMLTAQTVALSDPLLNETSFFVYPNPTSDAVRLRYVLDHDAPVSLCLADAQGKIAFEAEYGTQSAGTHQHEIDVRALPAGIYLMQLRMGREMETRRLTVQ